MPVKLKQDSKSQFYQYGTTGKKYRFKTARGKAGAKRKALRQESAIKASGYRGGGRFTIQPYRPPPFYGAGKKPLASGMRGGDNTGVVRAFLNKLSKNQTISKTLGRLGFSRLSTLVGNVGYGKKRRKVRRRRRVLR